MNKTLIILTFAVITAVGTGCDVNEVIQAVKGKEKAIVNAMDTADPIVSMLENAVPGWEGMNAKEQNKIVSVCRAIQERGGSIQEIMAMVGTMFPPAKPFTSSASSIIGLIALAAGAVERFTAHRKSKQVKAESEINRAIAVTALKAGEKVHGYGKAITEIKNGQASVDAVEELYRAEVKPKI